MVNKKGQNLFGQAVIFVALFFIGGVIGVLSLPAFEGRFYISGLVFAAFGLGLGNIVINLGHGKR